MGPNWSIDEDQSWWKMIHVVDEQLHAKRFVSPLSLFGYLSFSALHTHTHTHTDTLTHSFYWHLPTGCSFLFIDGFRLCLLCRDTQSRDRHSTSFWVFMNPIFLIFFFFFAVYNVLLFHWLTNVGFHLSLKESAKNQSEDPKTSRQQNDCQMAWVIAVMNSFVIVDLTSPLIQWSIYPLIRRMTTTH